jgi:hypothetical protein
MKTYRRFGGGGQSAMHCRQEHEREVGSEHHVPVALPPRKQSTLTPHCRPKVNCTVVHAFKGIINFKTPPFWALFEI